MKKKWRDKSNWREKLQEKFWLRWKENTMKKMNLPPPKYQQSYKFTSTLASKGKTDGLVKSPQFIALNSKGDLLIVDGGNNRIQVLNKTGQFLFKFGSYGNKDGQFSSPKGIAIDKDDNIIISDGNNKIQIFDSKGNFLSKFGSEGKENGQFNDPYGIAVDERNDNIVVCDSGNHRVQVFSRQGDYLFQFGTEGNENNQFKTPYGIAVDGGGNIMVADSGNNSVKVFDSKGNFIDSIGEGSDVRYPVGVAIDKMNDNNIVVGESYGDYKLQVFSNTGECLCQFGKNDEGEIDDPVGIVVDGESNIIVSDLGNHRIQVLSFHK